MRTCTLIYFMGELGTRVFEFQSKHPDKDAHELMIKNPPGPTVRDVALDDGYIRTIYLPGNPSFNGEIYRKAVEEKKWRESYFQRTGKHWHGEDQQTQSSERPPDADTNEKDSEEKNLSLDACRELLGLSRDFSEEELKEAYRKAVKMNHPDKVASLSDEFKTLAERKTKQINQAYSKLLDSCHSSSM